MSDTRVLFVSLTDDMGTDRLVSDMGRSGAMCAVIGPAGCVASLPRCVGAKFTLASGLRAPFMLRRVLARAVADWRPDRVVPLDDLAATLLRTLCLRSPRSSALHRLLVDSLGAPDGFAAACGRAALMAAAEAAGVRVPPFVAADGRWTRRLPDEKPMPVMVKRDQSSGSGGVTRADTSRELAKAIRSGWLKSAIKTQLARLAGFGRPITPVLVQRVIEGRLAMYSAVCREGRLIDGAGFVAVETHPVKGSSTILRSCAHPEMAEAARRLAAALGCSGFLSFDFILDAQNRAFLIEMNPRPIGSAHLGRRFGHDLVRAFLAGSRFPGDVVETAARDIALFPKELERDPSGGRLDDGDVVHDVPAHEPAVVAAYLKRLQAEHPAYAASLARRCGAAIAVPTSPAPSGVQPELC